MLKDCIEIFEKELLLKGDKLIIDNYLPSDGTYVIVSIEDDKFFIKEAFDIKYNKKVIVIGNEANGVEEKIQNMADVKVKIPMLGKTESLNASVATGIILYEYVRQKINE